MGIDVPTMDDVPASIDAIVSPDGSEWGGQRVGRSNHRPSSLDDISSLPDHCHNGS